MIWLAKLFCSVFGHSPYIWGFVRLPSDPFPVKTVWCSICNCTLPENTDPAKVKVRWI